MAARTAARVAGNGWGDEAAGDQRAWLRGRLRTGNGCGELRGRRGCKGGWKWVGRRSRWRSASLAARTAAEGKWVGRIARTAADGVGAREWLEMAAGDERAWLRGWLRTENGCGIARTAADGVGAREWLEMGREKKLLVMSELGCADGCGREMGAENCADGCGRRGCNGLAGNGWGEEAAGDERAWMSRMGNGCGEVRGRLRMAWVQRSGWKWVPLVMSELSCADGCGREMGADGCGRRRCKGVAGNGWGEEAAGDQRAWLRGQLRTGNGCGELRGRLRTAWVQRSGWKWVGRRSRWL